MAEGLDIRFNHVVERIDWGESGALILCSNGATFECDAVICTVSLGVLKVNVTMFSLNSPHTLQIDNPRTVTHALLAITLTHHSHQRIGFQSTLVYGLHCDEQCTSLQERHESMFSPALPAPKQGAIERLGMGLVDKLFIRFHSGKQPAADNKSAAETRAGRLTVSQKLFWKVGSTVGNAGFLPTEHRAPDDSPAAQPVAARSVLSHQLLWKVCFPAGLCCLFSFDLSFGQACPIF